MESSEYDVLSVGQWLVTLLLLSIPLVNIVLLLVWAFGGSAHPTRRNYSRASLLLFAIIVGFALLLVLLGVVLGGMGFFGAHGPFQVSGLLGG